MPASAIVVVGGSLGCIGPLQTIVRALPSGFPAAFLVVTHLSRDFPSTLAQILERAGELPVSQPKDGEPIAGGQIYVASPDRHLTLEDGAIRVLRGPRENRHRPALDPLFRTAARYYGPRVIATILSGQLDDGAAGMRAVRNRGGVAIVQEPEEAIAGQMPSAALRFAGADFVLPSGQIGPKIVELVEARSGVKVMAGNRNQRADEGKNDENLTVASPEEGVGTPSTFACPECCGVLWEFKDGELVRFRCRVGHIFTMATLHGEQAHAIENALWAAMRALEEKAALERRLSETMSDPRVRERFEEQCQDDRNHADAIRKILFAREDDPLDSAA